MTVPTATTMPSASRAAAAPRLRVQVLGLLPYAEALALQEERLAAVADGQGDELLLLEHPHVYTLGRGADADDLRGAPQRLGVPVFRIGRGGGATYHGPGQMVGYPIVRLRAAGRDVHRYVRALEAALTDICAAYGVTGTTPDGQTGVWVGERKLASIGIGVRRGVAWHGVALNVDPDLSYFAHIAPCRGSGLAVTSLRELLGRAPGLGEVGDVFAACLARRLDFAAAEMEPRA
jgi:lipoate-protein ligase B